MDYKSIRELIEAMSNSELSFLEVGLEGVKIIMKKESEKIIVNSDLDNVYINNQRRDLEESVSDFNNFEEVKKISLIRNNLRLGEEVTTENYKLVLSPIVGTFYSSTSIDSPSFVKVGSKVKKGDVLCIVEAMKLMNEIESEFDGEVVELLVHNEQLVEYNQPLFKIKA
ncbi:acetyl-CoA carboxylase biotin carboxyl carrier protein [Paraclostridium ghonii]|uniref:Biotin carboxyl carrier protein of acetyl-CoA carboxylase n=1 Tax=Paraclostridium ghonii TaxID=29358 RepID=A0ABU0N1E5_9FIRM|nr:acetyl-CoA carboxylase biotin carboxyl carrier protein [Paeniclostridium ghonii]MDQ0556536.1 acetyl-CoA carboxylase biotin carboxyl carrier protein [Paeniclostridium ghonii]